MTKSWLMGCEQKQSPGNSLQEKGHILPYPFLLPAGWNAEVMAEARAATMNHEEKATCQGCHRIEGTRAGSLTLQSTMPAGELQPPDFTSKRNKLPFCFKPLRFGVVSDTQCTLIFIDAVIEWLEVISKWMVKDGLLWGVTLI